MRILTHPVHTAWEYEFAKTGHEIFTVAPDDFKKLAPDWWGVCRGTLTGGPVWDTKNRPLPDNVRVISLDAALRMHFDVCIVHALPWLEELRNVSCPIIYKAHVIPPADFLPKWAEKVISALTFGNEVTMNKIVTKRPIFRNVIRVPIDSSIFDGYVGGTERCLAIANLVRGRPDKRFDRLDKIASVAPVDLLGGGNNGVSYAIGEARSFDELLSFYRNYAVFLEAGDYVSMSCREAMMVGMPVVLFLHENRKQKLFRNDENCIIAETEEEAAEAIKSLLGDPARRKRIGANARSSVLDLFDVNTFRRQWNDLLRKVVREHKILSLSDKKGSKF
ncbi:MAG: glycosyltransferase [Minisyncoccia bacterium]|jgi:hypothetical protein